MHLRFNRKNIIISLAVLLAAVLVVAGAYIALRGRDTLSVSENVYCVINGAETEFPGGVFLTHRDDVTTLKYEGNNYSLQSYPLIDKENGRIILQKSGTLNRTDSDEIARVDYYSELIVEDNVVLKRGKNKTTNLSGVYYDNGDLYVFFETATLSWGSNVIELHAGDIVECTYLDHLVIYKTDGSIQYFALTEDTVMATFFDGKRVNVATDRFYQKDGTWRLLYMPLGSLSSWQ